MDGVMANCKLHKRLTKRTTYVGVIDDPIKFFAKISYQKCL